MPDRSTSRLEAGLAGALGLAFGLSPAIGGSYDLGEWGPAGLLALVLLLGLAAARPPRLTRLAAIALLGLALLWLWALVSAGWAESAGQAMTEANRWLAYTALFAILVLLLRNERLAAIALAGGAAGVLCIAGYIVIRLVGGSGSELFTAGRLGFPLGYTNGQAGHLLLGLWPLVAAAERAPWRAARGAALGAATLLAGLVLLTQSRAALVALALSALLVLAAAPGRVTRFWALVTGALALAIAIAIEPFASLPVTTAVPVAEETARDAGLAILAAALAAGLGWTAALAAGAALTRRRPEASGALAAWAAAALVGVLVVGGLVAAGNPVTRVQDEYDSFRALEPPGQGGARVLSGGGNRYDYWRIAADQFTAHPVRGIGAGNYDRTYFVERQTTENVRQAHSIVLQLLGELGLVGLAAFALFAGAAFAGLFRRDRAGPLGAGLVVGAGGTLAAWLAHTSLDWLHLIPGVTALALVAAAALVAPNGVAPVRVPRLLALGLAIALVVAGAVTLGRSVLADHHRANARDALPEDPERALEESEDALSLDDQTLRGWYLGAAAQARLGDYAGAVATLGEAVEREPHDFLTYALLGDLATRRGDRAAARRWYARASALNPRSTELAARARGEQPPP